jgi:hypothetical protein
MNLTNAMANATFPAAIQMCYSNGEYYPFMFKFPSSFAYAFYLFACILSGIIFLTTVGLNSLTVLTFWRTRRLRENNSLFLVMVLSLVDLGIGALCNSLLTISLTYDLIYSPECWLYGVQAKSFPLATIFSLSIVAAISTERYFGVVHPLIHRTKVTKVKLWQLLLFIWSCCAVVSSPAYFNKNPLLSFWRISILFLILITICSYVKIAITVIRSKIQREKLTEDNRGTGSQQSDSAKENRKNIMYFLKELKMAKSSLLVVLCYLMCYTPTLVVTAIFKKRLSPLTSFYVRPWCLLSVMLNSSLNSIIFFWRSAPLRNEAKNVLKNIKLEFFQS